MHHSSSIILIHHHKHHTSSYSYIIMLINKTVRQTIVAYPGVRSLTWLVLAKVLPNQLNVSSRSLRVVSNVAGVLFLITQFATFH